VTVKSQARTVEEYLEALLPERREPLSAVRGVILANLPEGFEEGMNWGMISYEIPLSRYPKTYNKQPLMMAALASQKNFMALYLTGVYGDPETGAWFRERYAASGKKLDMGKSCIRFRRLEDLPLELVGEVIRRCTVEAFIERYERSRGKKEAGLELEAASRSVK
jgi:uncharacterized protein YdhG (YjbR/CyaY superfamily)